MPDVLNGPTVALSLPLSVAFTVGAPLSVAGCGVSPFQVPFLMMCCADESSTRVSESPFLMFIEL